MSHSVCTTLYAEGKKITKKGKNRISLKQLKMLPSEPEEGFLEVVVTLG